MSLTNNSMNVTIILYFAFITASSDYNAVEGNQLTFTPEVNVSCTTVVPIIDDAVLEDNQTFSVVLITSDPDALVNPAFATVTIVDNDGKISLALSKCNILDFKFASFFHSSQMPLWVCCSHPT